MFPAEQREVSVRATLVSLLTTIAGICFATIGFVLDNAIMMVAGMVLGGIVANLIGNAMSRRLRFMRRNEVSGAGPFVHR
jgi:NAD/NADP transhydrogenase beta subunit